MSNECHSSAPPGYSVAVRPSSPSLVLADTANEYSSRSEIHVGVADGAPGPAGAML